jgi:hypothetical protein
MEMVVKAYIKGFRITEIPTVWVERSAGKSKFHLANQLPKYIFWYFYALINTWLGKI